MNDLQNLMKLQYRQESILNPWDSDPLAFVSKDTSAVLF